MSQGCGTNSCVSPKRCRPADENPCDTNTPFFNESPKTFLKYDLEDQLPIWLDGIFKNVEKRKFYDLFDEELEFKNLDKASQDAKEEDQE